MNNIAPSKKPKGLWLDLETTGTDPKLCGIHRVSCILVTDEGEVERNWFIKPFEGAIYEEGWEVGRDLSRERVEAYTITEKVFLNQFRTWVGTAVSKFDSKDKLFFIGYAANFDSQFIRATFERGGDKFFGSYFWTPVIDIMPLLGLHLRNIRHTLPNFKLATVYEYVVGKPLEDAHDGIADIRATRELFRKVFPDLENAPAVASVSPKDGEPLTTEQAGVALHEAMQIIESVGTTGIHDKWKQANSWMKEYFPIYADPN